MVDGVVQSRWRERFGGTADGKAQGKADEEVDDMQTPRRRVMRGQKHTASQTATRRGAERQMASQATKKRAR